jgi:hypothetical protein
MNTRSDHLEKPMTFDGVTLTPQKEVVRAFYKDMWDHADVTLIPQIFHEDFTFRGSLGPVLVGHAQFADYVRWVTGVLQNYTTDILLMIEEGNRVSGKVYFHGVSTRSDVRQSADRKARWLAWSAYLFVRRAEGARPLGAR